jgi:hypothetical protein
MKPTDPENPYATPQAKVRDRSLATTAVAEGSYGLGLACGGILGLWGVIGCALLAKADTKRGALHGFLGRLVLVLVIVALAAATA